MMSHQVKAVLVNGVIVKHQGLDIDGNIEWINHYDENGWFHREDGPAWENCIKPDNNIWYWHGQGLPVKSQQEFEVYVRLKSFW